MRFHNTSRYPEARVRELVEFGMRGVNTAGLAVNVKNAVSCAYRGRAYQQAPRCSPTSKLVTVRYLVTIGIGPATMFPCDNMVGAWKDCSEEFIRIVNEGVLPGREHPTRKRSRGWQWWDERAHPYGGKSSPQMEYRSWEEGLVAVAAHEARHIYQFAHGKPRSEVDCERWAAKRLEEWRARS